jgi:hypothetical protein
LQATDGFSGVSAASSFSIPNTVFFSIALNSNLFFISALHHSGREIILLLTWLNSWISTAHE